MSSGGLARLILWVGQWLVPRSERTEWKLEWAAELSVLEGSGPEGAQLPTPVGFVLGALPHAVMMRMEGWTMDQLFLDLRYALRGLRRSPGFTAVAVLTLALGIGANAAIFSMVNALVLRPPVGVTDADQLVQIGRLTEAEPGWGGFSWLNSQAVRQETPGLAMVEGYSLHQWAMGEGENRTAVLGHFVTGGWFSMLGTQARVGRLFQPSDDVQIGGHPVVVLGYNLWRDRYGADVGIVGQSVLIDGAPYQVLGVAEEGYLGIHTTGLAPSIFIPATMNPGYGGDLPYDSWRWSWLNLVGRMEAGVSFPQVDAAMPLVTDRLRAAAPENETTTARVLQGVGLDPVTADATRRLATMLAAIVGLLLLLTCTNVANLFLSRAAGREGEVGVRLALGAGGGRVTRQLLTESILLAGIATIAALPIVLFANDLLPAFVPLDFVGPLTPDIRVFAFLALAGLLAAMIFGLAPAWSATRNDLIGALRDGASTSRRSRNRLQEGLIIAQLSLSLGLVTGAALLGRSIQKVRGADPGFESRGLYAGAINLNSGAGYDDVSGVTFLSSVLASLNQTPGVRSATIATQLPIAGGQNMGSVYPSGRPELEPQVEMAGVGPDYFETLGIPVVAGRGIGDFQDEGELVAVVSESLAETFWPGEDPIGQTMRDRSPIRVVGVVPDVQIRSLRDAPNPAVYFPLVYAPQPRLQVVVSIQGAGLPAAELIQRAVDGQDPAMPVGITDVRATVLDSMSDIRTIGMIVIAFAALALVLAVVGLYGLVSMQAKARTREFGIRLALGARPGLLTPLVLRRTGGLLVLGLLGGLGASYGVGRALQSVLFGVGPIDPLAFLGSAAVLLLVSLVATIGPARAAGRADPVVTLRDSA